MNLRSNILFMGLILVVGLIFSIVCFLGCKKKTEPAKAEPPKGEVSLKADSKSPEPNIVQQAAVESNTIEPKIMESTKVDIKTIEPNVTTTPEPKQVIATVNGIEILKSDYEARVEQQIGPVQRQMSANFFEQYKKELGKKVLDEMVVDILIGQKAKQKGIVVTDQEIDRRINEFVRRQRMSLQDYRDMLAAKGEDFSQFRVQVRQNQMRRYHS